MAKKGTVTIHGKQYKTVATRVNDFRQSHKVADGWAILTKIHSLTREEAVVHATIVAPDGKEVASGFARELQGDSQINKKSFLENCETSAIGRALASAGYGGDEYASADEVAQAITQRGSDRNGQPPDQPSEKTQEETFYTRSLNKIRNLNPQKVSGPELKKIEAGILQLKSDKKITAAEYKRLMTARHELEMAGEDIPY